jgi:hypothetical protein
MKKALITVSLVAIATVVLLFCFRAISGAEEKSVSGGSVGIASFVIFVLLSVYLAMKLNNSLPPVEDLKGEN